MNQELGRFPLTIAYPNDNPFLNDAWRPVDGEWVATNARPRGDRRDPAGPERPPRAERPQPRARADRALTHPYDGDGMIHAIRFREGHAEYRNRFVRTTGFLAEQAAGRSLWPGIIEPGRAARRGWGSIGAMKDNAGTDVILHAGELDRGHVPVQRAVPDGSAIARHARARRELGRPRDAARRVLALQAGRAHRRRDAASTSARAPPYSHVRRGGRGQPPRAPRAHRPARPALAPRPGLHGALLRDPRPAAALLRSRAASKGAAIACASGRTCRHASG